MSSGQRNTSVAPVSEQEMISQMEELENVFSAFDEDGDGKISCREVLNIISQFGYLNATEEQLQRMIGAVDSDGDGFINVQEFIELNSKDIMDVMGEHMDDLRSAFATLDLEQSGCITAAELHAVLNSLGEPATIDDCQQIIACIDVNGDGIVTLEEFYAHVSNDGAYNGSA